MNEWIGVDLDGTLAEYDKFVGPSHIGAPISKMVARVRQWLSEGKDVRIFTARVYGYGSFNGARHKEAVIAKHAIDAFTMENFGKVLPVTCVKDYGMVELWDDRAVQVVKNTGDRADATKDETGWLVEVVIDGRPAWLKSADGIDFTADSSEALRFARERDAKNLISTIVMPNKLRHMLVATEHLWS